MDAMTSGDSADVLAPSLSAIDTFSGTLQTLDLNLNIDQKRFGLLLRSAIIAAICELPCDSSYRSVASVKIFIKNATVSIINTFPIFISNKFLEKKI
jgi:hypothetical protein